VSGETTLSGPIDKVVVEAQSPAQPGVNMPDHWIRGTWGYQLFVRAPRPALEWATLAWFIWVTIIQPHDRGVFDVAATGMCLAWCATIFGFKLVEKLKGVS
jgi:hypothetical protein